MRIEWNDPGRCFGTNEKAVAKVVDAMSKISIARAIKSGGRAVKDMTMQIAVGLDEWHTHIRIVDHKGIVIGYYICGEYAGTISKRLEIIY